MEKKPATDTELLLAMANDLRSICPAVKAILQQREMAAAAEVEAEIEEVVPHPHAKKRDR